MLKAIALIKFARGPAKDTIAVSLLKFLKLYGLIGTGRAQPIFAIKSIIVPMGSRCLRGLSVNRPALFAVSSPSLYAA